MARASSSEDEFPNVEAIVRKHKQKPTGEPNRDGKKAPRPIDPLESGQTSFNESIGKTPAAARRRRRLGQGQLVDSSLVKPWKGLDMEIGATSRAPSSRQPTWSRTKTEEAGSALAGELLDRLPVKAKRAESRVPASGTAFDSPPEEPKRTRRLISRGEKKALEQKREQEEDDDWIVSSDESESDDEEDASDHVPSSEDEESDFVLGGTSDSDDLVMPPPRRSESPSAPRRMPRRVLSSSRDPSKKEPTQTKTIQDDTTTKSKKRIEKQNVPKISATRQLKAAPKGKLEDAFKELKIFNEESDPEEPAARGTKAPILEPSTPKKNLAASPGKPARIPDSPWKPEHKEFWDPEVNFAWIDEHSPPKKAPKKLPDLAAPDSREELKRRYGTSPEKKQAKKAFDAVKEDLARDFLRELDEVITDGRLEALTESTGGLRLVWSNTLLTTAGRAHWKCKTTTTTLKQPSSSSSASSSAAITKTATQHYASIELATKVLSNESDLLNTVAHEFCHLAVFLLHGKPKLAHGAEFKTYGRRVMSAASRSPSSSSSAKNGLKTPGDRGVEINVTTRHSYEIEYRFVWRCADCAAEVCRHSRSVDPTRQRCGRCKGILVQVKPVPRGSGTSNSNSNIKGNDKGDAGNEGSGLGGGKDSTGAVKGKGAGALKPEKKKTAYQEFTSREMKALSISHKGLSFKEKMAMVSARWSEHQKKQKEMQEQEKEQGLKTKAATPETEPTTTPTATVTTKAVGVRGLTASVEVLEIRDDGSDPGSDEDNDNNGKGAVYDIFA